MIVIIRGSLGVGKTTIAKRVVGVLGATYVSVDRVLDDHDLASPEGIPLENFLKANEFIVGQLGENAYLP